MISYLTVWTLHISILTITIWLFHKYVFILHYCNYQCDFIFRNMTLYTSVIIYNISYNTTFYLTVWTLYLTLWLITWLHLTIIIIWHYISQYWLYLIIWFYKLQYIKLISQLWLYLITWFCLMTIHILIFIEILTFHNLSKLSYLSIITLYLIFVTFSQFYFIA